MPSMCIAGALLRPQYASGPPPVQHQSPHTDHMLSPPHGGQSQGPGSPSQPQQDPRGQRGQGQVQSQGYNPGYRQNPRQLSGGPGPPDRQGPTSGPHYPSQAHSYSNSPDHADDQQDHQQQRPDGRDPNASQVTPRFGRGGGHVSGAKAILLPGPPFGGQSNRGRGRGRSDGTYVNPRGRGRSTRGRG